MPAFVDASERLNHAYIATDDFLRTFVSYLPLRLMGSSAAFSSPVGQGKQAMIAGSYSGVSHDTNNTDVNRSGQVWPNFASCG